jgi:hypothetical protein
MTHRARTALASRGLLALLAALPAAAGGEAWRGLDAELEQLRAATSQQHLLEWEVIARPGYVYSDAGLLGLPIGSTTTSAALVDAEVTAKGTLGNFNWRFTYDFAPLDEELQWAYGSYHWEDWWEFQLGQYRFPATRSADMPSDGLMFPTRSIIGRAFDVFDTGAAAKGRSETWAWMLSVQNGDADVEYNFLFAGRLAWSFNGGVDELESSWHDFTPGQRPKRRGGFGATIFQDESLSDGDGITGDAVYAVGPWFVAGEVAQLGKGARQVATDPLLPTIVVEGDSTPWGVSAGVFVLGREIELVGRYEDVGDFFDTRATSAGFNWWHRGRDVRWQLAWTGIEGQWRGNIVQFVVTLHAGTR